MFVFTSCTNNYIPKARVLASSLKKQHPNWEFCLLLGEALPERFDLSKEPFDRVHFFDQLNIPDYEAWLFRHRVVEICTAAKGPALYYFLEIEKHNKVIYIDPDIMVLNSLEPLSEMLDTADVLLTPHQLAPQKNYHDIVYNEICSLQHGVYNLGFVGVARRGQGLEFAHWWRERLLHFCYDDIPRGIFTDQRWCDLAPAFFSNLKIINDPGYNAASWNLTDRTITQDDAGIFMANDVPLRFYHFTGFDSGAGERATAIYGVEMPAVAELWKIYKERLNSFDNARLKQCKWVFTVFDNGEKITDEMRLTYRNRPDLQALFPEPFNTQKEDCFLNWYNNEQRWVKRNPVVHRAKKAWGITKKHVRRKGLISLPRYACKALRILAADGVQGLKQWFKVQEHTAPYSELIHREEERSLTVSFGTCNVLRNITKLLHSVGCDQPLLLIFTISWDGGAADYLVRNLESTHKDKPFLLLKWDSSTGGIKGKLHYCDLQADFVFDDIDQLLPPNGPALGEVWINDLVGWSMRDERGMVMPFWIAVPKLLKKIEILCAAHKGILRIFFHEHFALCPQWSLLKPDLKHCDLLEEDSACRECLGHWFQKNVGGFSINQWRDAWRELICFAEELRFFSQSSRNTTGKVFELPESRVVIQPHHPLVQWNQTYEVPQNVPMTIAVVGSIYGKEKGSSIISALAKLLEDEERLVIIGTVAGVFPSNTFITGRYKREVLPQILREHKVTVGFMPSICPETFSYVTQECMSLGLPMVSFPLGAQGERIGAWEHGLLAEDVSPEKALAALRKLHKKHSATSDPH